MQSPAVGRKKSLQQHRHVLLEMSRGPGIWQAGHEPSVCPGGVKRSVASKSREAFFLLYSALVRHSRTGKTTHWTGFSGGTPRWLRPGVFAL